MFTAATVASDRLPHLPVVTEPVPHFHNYRLVGQTMFVDGVSHFQYFPAGL